MDKKLSVRLNGEPVGILEQDIQGKMNFQYLPEANTALSLSLPLQQEPFDDVTCKAAFGGLLPESEHARKVIAKKYSINAKNDFSLLKAIGYDCAGAISFHSIEEPIKEIGYTKLQGKPLSEDKLAEHINALPQRPLFLDEQDFRLSLAGVQDKAAVCVINNEICMPADGSPTTHILKPIIKDLEETIENEYLCLKVAKGMGIEVPNVEIKQAKNAKYLLVERYDREIKNGLIKRVHQEDFCQALGVVSAYKYQSDGGPGLKECFDLLKKVSRPAIDRNKLAERVVFNFLIGNTDAHGKNFSLLHYENATIKLAPMYDVLCTPVYDLTKKMAMKVGGYYEYDKILPRHWERFCDEVGLSYPQLKKIITKQAKELPQIIEGELNTMAKAGMSTIIANKILDFTTQNCAKNLKKFVG